MTLFDALVYGGLFLWLAVSLFLIFRLRVFSRPVLVNAPTRQSTLSLPVVGAAILAYLFINLAVLLAAMQLGYVHKSDLGIVEPPTPVPALRHTTQPSTEPTTDPRPASRPETVPTTQTQPSEDPAVMLQVIGAIAELLTAATVLSSIPYFFKTRFRGWGLHLAQLPKGLLLGLFGFLIVYPILLSAMMGSEWVFNFFQHTITEHPTFETLDKGIAPLDQLILYAIAAIVAPLAEEIFFRGLLQTSLIQFSWGFVIPQFMRPLSLPQAYRPNLTQRWAAIGISSVVFASVHPSDHIAVIFLLSVALGYIYERTGNLWSSITLHALFNSSSLLLYFIFH